MQEESSAHLKRQPWVWKWGPAAVNWLETLLC